MNLLKLVERCEWILIDDDKGLWQCQSHEEMPEELRNLFDKMFGGNK